MRKGVGGIEEGQKFGRLIADCFYYSGENGSKFWVCTCDCGDDDVIVAANNLKGGTVRSCGCLSNDHRKAKRLSNNGAEITQVILSYKRSAKKRGHKWELGKRFAEKLLRGNCHYCNIEPSMIKIIKHSTIEPLHYNGIDRKDNTKGYTQDNVVPCCKVCNRAKWDMPYEDYINWIEGIKNATK